MTWGIDEHVLERFGAAGIPADRISLERDTFVFSAADAADGVPRDVPALLRPDHERVRGGRRRTAGPTSCSGELEILFKEQNQARDDDTTSIPATFLRVTVEV